MVGVQLFQMIILIIPKPSSLLLHNVPRVLGMSKIDNISYRLSLIFGLCLSIFKFPTPPPTPVNFKKLFKQN